MHEQHLGREAVEKTDAQTAAICLSCGRPLTRRGPAGECPRCLVSLAFLPDGEPLGEGIATRRRVVPDPLSYVHFDVEVGVDGFPVELGAGAMAVTYRARDTILRSIVALKVVDRQMAENPAARPQSARELLAAVHLCCKTEQEAPAVFEAATRREEGFWVAVLPFKFSGTNSEIAVLSEGLNEEIVIKGSGGVRRNCAWWRHEGKFF